MVEGVIRHNARLPKAECEVEGCARHSGYCTPKGNRCLVHYHSAFEEQMLGRKTDDGLCAFDTVELVANAMGAADAKGGSFEALLAKNGSYMEHLRYLAKIAVLTAFSSTPALRQAWNEGFDAAKGLVPDDTALELHPLAKLQAWHASDVNKAIEDYLAELSK